MFSEPIQKNAVKAYTNNSTTVSSKNAGAATLPAVPVQKKPIQKVEEEEAVQGKFTTQLKADTGIAQLQETEEETMQGEFNREPALQDKARPVQPKFVLQKKANATGLPDSLKAGIEHLSGHGMDDVKVHYNSAKPAQLQALAYAQGTDIHIGPGQEKHLPHEAWHVVQQKQGRVQPTMQMKGGVAVNDDAGLENEADVMGAKAQMATQLASIEELDKPAKATQFKKGSTQLFTGKGPFQFLKANSRNKPSLDEALQNDMFKDDIANLRACFAEATQLTQFLAHTADQTAFDAWKAATGRSATGASVSASSPSTASPSSAPTTATLTSTPATPSTPPVLGVATKLSELDANESAYKAKPALYAESIVNAGGTKTGYSIAPMAKSADTVNVSLKKGKHKAVVHYHPKLTSGSDVHAKLTHKSAYNELLPDTKLTAMGLAVRATVRGWTWRKNPSTGAWTK